MKFPARLFRTFVANLQYSRAALFGTGLDGTNPDRNINKECGYPDAPVIKDFREFFDREGTARRVVSVFPDECFAALPGLYEDEDNTTQTAFEKAVEELNRRLNLWHYFHRVDVRSGIGRFGVLLYGFNDVQEEADFAKPAPGLDPDTGESTGEPVQGVELLYIRAYDETNVQINKFVSDPGSRRYGQAEYYDVDVADLRSGGVVAFGDNIKSATLKVHWTRCVHVAEGVGLGEVYATPRMLPVLNRLYDVRKILSSSGEMFWKGAFPGYSFETTPNMEDSDFEVDEETLKKQFDSYMNGLQRYLALSGVTAKSLAPQIGDPSNHLAQQLQSIAMCLGVPYRIFLGSEAAHLASTQDIGTWNRRLLHRQKFYLEPMLIRPAVDRLINVGVLPRPKQYKVDWQDLNSVSDKDQADMALKQTQALMGFVTGHVESVMEFQDFLVEILNMPVDRAEKIVKNSQKTGLKQKPTLDPVVTGKDPAAKKPPTAARAGSGPGA